MKDSERLLKRFHKSSMMTDNSSDSESSDDSIAGTPSTPGTSASNNSTGDICSSIQKLIVKATSPEKAQLAELGIYSALLAQNNEKAFVMHKSCHFYGFRKQ